MINEIISSFDNINVVLLMADTVFLSKSGNIQKYLGQYKDFVDKSEAPIFLVLNKIDKLQKETVLEIIGQINQFYEFTEIIPVSALKGFNTDTLIKVIKKYLNKGADFKDNDNTEITDLSDKLYVSEIIREKIINLTKQEIPHSVACNTVELIQRNKNTIYINTEIIVERNSQKGIIIGKQGQMLKKIGEQSRKELQKYFDKKIYIELFVKVIENWRNSEKTIKQAGY
jgi:GTP-binding protein Era